MCFSIVFVSSSVARFSEEGSLVGAKGRAGNPKCIKVFATCVHPPPRPLSRSPPRFQHPPFEEENENEDEGMVAFAFGCGFCRAGRGVLCQYCIAPARPIFQFGADVSTEHSGLAAPGG